MAKKKINRYDEGDIHTVIVQYFKDHNTRSFTSQQVIKKFAGQFQRFEIMHNLEKLAEKGVLIEADQRYKFHMGKRIMPGGEVEGIIDFTRKGDAFVLVEGAARDIFIAQQNTK